MPRATATDKTKRIWIITGVIILIVLVVGGIFCCIVLCLVHRRKQQIKKRNLDLGTANATNTYRGYQPVDNMELGYGGVQEMPGDYYHPGHKAELPSYEVQRVQQSDGFISAPNHSAQPVELPSNIHIGNGNYR